MKPIWYKDKDGNWQLFPHLVVEQLPDGRWAWTTRMWDLTGLSPREVEQLIKKFTFDHQINRWIFHP